MNSLRNFQRFTWWHETLLLIMLIVLMFGANHLVPGFADWKGQLFLSRHLWDFALLTISMTLIILTGGIDLSVGSLMGLCAVTFGLTFQTLHRIDLAVISCLMTGLLGGALNGLFISRFRQHPLIITLATYATFRGMAEGISQGNAYSQFGSSFSQFARGTWNGIPYPGLIFAAIFLACGVWLAISPTGRYLYAIGYNERASRFSGIAVDRIRMGLYSFSGLMAGLASLIYVSRFDTAKADAGKGFELDVITAVVVGGTSIFGGRGNLLGTLLGLLLIHELRLFVGRYWEIEELKPIVIGVVLIMSILVSRALSRQDQR